MFRNQVGPPLFVGSLRRAYNGPGPQREAMLAGMAGSGMSGTEQLDENKQASMTMGEMLGLAESMAGSTLMFDNGEFLGLAGNSGGKGILLPALDVEGSGSGLSADWAAWGRKVDDKFGSSLGYNFKGYGSTPGWLSWDGPIARAIIPDKLSVNISGDIAFFAGVGASPISFTLLTRGDPGVYITPVFSRSFGDGVKAEGTLGFSAGWYSGKPSEINRSMLTGHTFALNIGATAIVGGNFGYSLSPTGGGQRFDNLNIGFSGGIDVSPVSGVSIEVSDQITTGYGPLITW